MIIFDATAPDGSSERFRFGSRAEADAAAEMLRAAGCSIAWIVWAETLGRWVTIPED